MPRTLYLQRVYTGFIKHPGSIRCIHFKQCSNGKEYYKCDCIPIYYYGKFLGEYILSEKSQRYLENRRLMIHYQD